MSQLTSELLKIYLLELILMPGHGFEGGSSLADDSFGCSLDHSFQFFLKIINSKVKNKVKGMLKIFTLDHNQTLLRKF